MSVHSFVSFHPTRGMFSALKLYLNFYYAAPLIDFIHIGPDCRYVLSLNQHHTYPGSELLKSTFSIKVFAFELIKLYIIQTI